MKKPTGIFGGTFDPFHNGHLSTLQDVLSGIPFQFIRVIPAATPAHRDAPSASAEHRLKMATLATVDQDKIEIDDIELKRSTASYTFDTIRELSELHQNEVFSLIIGIDAFLLFESWYRWDEILTQVNIIVMNRPGYPIPDPLPMWWQSALIDSVSQFNLQTTGQIHHFNVTPNPISATQLRQRILADECVTDALHPAVWEYITENKLYGHR